MFGMGGRADEYYDDEMDMDDDAMDNYYVEEDSDEEFDPKMLPPGQMFKNSNNFPPSMGMSALAQ